MNNKLNQQFRHLMQELFDSVRDVLCFESWSVDQKGSIIVGKLIGNNGHVKLLYGPPEYHVEIFLISSATGKEYDLAQMMSVKGVREWMEENRLSFGDYGLSSDFEWVKSFLINAVSNNEEFNLETLSVRP